MVAAEAARITHKHPLGFLPSAVLNDILMQIFDGEMDRGTSLSDIVHNAIKRLPSIKSETDKDRTYGELWPDEVATLRRLLKYAMELTVRDIPDHVAIEKIGGGWTGHEALAIAIYSAVKHSNSFENAIVSSVNHSGDSDSTGAICGNIMGALLGRNAIPDYYTKDLELLDIIEEMAEDLFTGCIISECMERDTPETRRWFEKYCLFKWIPKCSNN
jgi:ADP-ribosylglycohydrolase